MEKLIDVMGLTFDEDTHVYKLDGIELPSVTTIMKPLSDSVYGGVNNSVLMAAAAKGTDVHNAIESYLLYGIDTVDPDFGGYYNAFKAWYESVKPVVKGSEVRLYHKLLRYSGTADLVAEIDGELCLVDYKTTQVLQSKLCGVQLMAYAQALKTSGVEIKKHYILHLKKDGTYAFVNYEAKPEYWKVFMSLKTIYDYKNS